LVIRCTNWEKAQEVEESPVAVAVVVGTEKFSCGILLEAINEAFASLGESAGRCCFFA